jgi:hypothetical protein
VWPPKKKPKWEEGKGKEGKGLLSTAVPSPPMKTVTTRLSSSTTVDSFLSAKQVVPALPHIEVDSRLKRSGLKIMRLF